MEQIRSTQLAGTLVFAPLAKLCLAFKGDKKW
nr:MAG TPA: hypothetical protein [Caudoviricetes sp.]